MFNFVFIQRCMRVYVYIYISTLIQILLYIYREREGQIDRALPEREVKIKLLVRGYSAPRHTLQDRDLGFRVLAKP